MEFFNVIQLEGKKQGGTRGREGEKRGDAGKEGEWMQRGLKEQFSRRRLIVWRLLCVGIKNLWGNKINRKDKSLFD